MDQHPDERKNDDSSGSDERTVAGAEQAPSQALGEAVVIVHGTNASDAEWIQPGSQFLKSLARHIETARFTLSSGQAQIHTTLAPKQVVN